MNKQWSLKHRPSKFENMVVGNPEILQEAEKAVSKTTAVLVTGETGTGKTTFARCFAHAVNGSAHGIIEESSTDRGVGYIRELEAKLKFSPPKNKWVVIIDEVHNLTKDATKAMLKLLEDPPHGKIVFILCTNHPYMLIPEVKNRCRLFEIQKPSLADGSKALVRILKREKMDAPIEDMRKVAKFAFTTANHCMRQALQNLESLFDRYQSGVSVKELLKGKVSETGEKQQVNETQKVAGQMLLALLDAFETKKAEDAVGFIIPTMTTVDPKAVVGSMQGTLYYGFALANGGNWQWQAKDYKTIFKGKKLDSEFVVKVLPKLSELSEVLTTSTSDPVVLVGSRLAGLAKLLASR